MLNLDSLKALVALSDSDAEVRKDFEMLLQDLDQYRNMVEEEQDFLAQHSGTEEDEHFFTMRSFFSYMRKSWCKSAMFCLVWLNRTAAAKGLPPVCDDARRLMTYRDRQEVEEVMLRLRNVISHG